MTKTLKQKIFSGVFWQGFDRLGSQGLQFVISVILARLLMPEDFGLVAITSVFINLGQVFIDSGFSSALIQKKDADDIDCNSVFYINIFVAFVLYCIMFITAPFIANFYHSGDLAKCLRVLSLGMVIRSFSLVQLALLNKKMLFHLNCRIGWTALLISGGVGIFFAYKGYGVWALIIQSLIHAALSCILQWIFIKWRPRLIFDKKRIMTLFQFGWKLFCASILDTLYNNLYTILIGKLFDLKTLSFYQRGQNVPMLGMGIVNSTVGTVIFPAFSQLQDDKAKMKALAEKSLKNVIFCVTPVLGVLFITADPLVRILFTEKWLPCVVFLQLSCIISLFWPLYTLNLQIIVACGRSDLFLILEVVKKIQCVVVILLTFRHGVLIMVWGLVVSSPLLFMENSFFNGKLINYSCVKQIRTLLPFVIVGIISGGIGYFCSNMFCASWSKLFVGSCTFLSFYLLMSWVFDVIPEELLKIVKIKMVVKNA